VNTDLIRIEPVTMDGKDVFCIDARDVHARLGVGRDFTSWLKGRIKKYGLRDGTDYRALPKLGSATAGHRGDIVYMLTAATAGILAAVEGSPAAAGFRKDLMDALALMARKPPVVDYAALMNDDAFMDALLEDRKRRRAENKALVARIEADRPMTELGRVLTCGQATFSFGVVASVLGAKGVRHLKRGGQRTGIISRNDLLADYRHRGLLISQNDDRWNCPSQKGIESGLVVLRQTACDDGVIRNQPFLTLDGIREAGWRYLETPLEPEDIPADRFPALALPGR
jgi:phage antirepressor YoqD-like protein